jgi:Trp operon repressor
MKENIESLSTKVERSQIEWRRSKVAELDSQGHSQPETSRMLQVSIGTVNRDLSILRQQAKDNIKRYVDERLPEEYEKCLVGLTAITKEAWNTAANTEDKREKILALSLAKECYSMKLDLLTNAVVVDDAIRFVSRKSKAQLKCSSHLFFSSLLWIVHDIPTIIPVIIISTITDEIKGDTIEDRYRPKNEIIIIIDNTPKTVDSITHSLSLPIITNGENNVYLSIS